VSPAFYRVFYRIGWQALAPVGPVGHGTALLVAAGNDRGRLSGRGGGAEDRGGVVADRPRQDAQVHDAAGRLGDEVDDLGDHRGIRSAGHHDGARHDHRGVVCFVEERPDVAGVVLVV
jgi:hypothetical protein